jgi:hypothetical protein
MWKWELPMSFHSLSDNLLKVVDTPLRSVWQREWQIKDKVINIDSD